MTNKLFTEGLLPCPFCAFEPEPGHITQGHFWALHYHNQSKIKCPLAGFVIEGKEGFKQWNTRTGQTDNSEWNNGYNKGFVDGYSDTDELVEALRATMQKYVPTRIRTHKGIISMESDNPDYFELQAFVEKHESIERPEKVDNSELIKRGLDWLDPNAEVETLYTAEDLIRDLVAALSKGGCDERITPEHIANQVIMELGTGASLQDIAVVVHKLYNPTK